MTEYGSTNPYENYGDKTTPSPYDLLMQMKAWNKEIYLTVENMDKEVRTALQVLDGEIKGQILDVKNGLETQIQANAQGIATKVSKTDFTGSTVASLITQTPSAISALAQSLNLSGYVTFNSLTAAGTTNIDGARITTGLISADRLQASVILSKLIQAGGIDAGYITSGTISTSRLSADAIRTTLLQAGGISADLITAGTISGSRINGGTITGVGLNGYGINGTVISASESMSAPNLYMGSFGMISWPDGSRISKSGSGLQIYAPGGVSIPGFQSSGVETNTVGLGLGYSSTSKRLYVRINGSDVGFIPVT